VIEIFIKCLCLYLFMKRIIFLCVCFFMCSFISASIEVHNYSVENLYSSGNIVKGEINLTISGENYGDEIISNKGDEMSLEDFFDINGANYSCIPSDCSKRYKYSNEQIQKYFNILSSEDKDVGFVLIGGNIVISNLSFNLESNFRESSSVPLAINFFEKEEWEFNDFSDSFMDKNWGCYDSSIGAEDARIGNSFYCEMISIPDSKFLQVGAKVGGSGSEELNMRVYPENGLGTPWKCSFDPNVKDKCKILPDHGDIFHKGNYQVCVGASVLTSRKIYTENRGDNCGFAYGSNSGNSVKDYAIFAQANNYANSSFFSVSDFNYEKIIEAANLLIQKKYKGNCSDGCVLPMSFSGVNQNVLVSNIKLVYNDDSEWASSDKIYDLDVVSAVVDFSGILNLDLLTFVVDEFGEFIVSLNGKTLFKENFQLSSAPTISSVFPLDPPFSVPVRFYANIDSVGNKTLKYEWNFGDNVTLETQVPYVSHSYELLGNYTLSLKIDAGGGLFNEKSFLINTASPDVAIATNLAFKRKRLQDVGNIITAVPDWYREKMSSIVDIDVLDNYLDRIEKSWNSSSNDESLKNVAQELFAFDVPILIAINSVSSPYLMTSLADINIKPIEGISGVASSSSNKDYINPVLTWQNDNVEASYFEKEFVVVYSNGNQDSVLRVYDIDVTSMSSDKSYFVINRLFDELVFKKDLGARKVGDYTVITLDSGKQEKFEFYYEGTEPTSFFVSPKLSSLIIAADIDTSCNYNLVCEKENDETYKNCRTDCKPTGLAFFYFFIGFFALLFVYTGLQIWYKKRYESYLFKDAAQLYNLLMYVANARARGMNDLRIRAELISKGWSSERVNYVMKKSRGKRTGMFDIIPIEFISAFLRDRKAANREKKRVATLTKQQGDGNINKSRLQRRK